MSLDLSRGSRVTVLGVLLASSVACAHAPCLDQAVLEGSRPLSQQTGAQGAPICVRDGEVVHVGAWGAAPEPDLVVGIARGELDAAYGWRPSLSLRGACAGGRRRALRKADLAKAEAALVRTPSRVVQVLVVGTEAEDAALALGRALTAAGREVYYRTVPEAPAAACRDLRETYAAEHPSARANDGLDGARADVGLDEAHATTSTAAATVEGALTLEQIAAVLRPTLRRFLGCFQAELKRTPTLDEGKLDVQFLVAPDGSVAGSELLVNTLSPAAGACVQGVLSALHFPAPRDGRAALVTYPFVFVTQ